MTAMSGPDSLTLRPPPNRRTLRERWRRRPPGIGFWMGAGLLGLYLVAALSALVVFRGSLDRLPETGAWVPPFSPIGPSWAHPFGIIPGFGTDLFRAVWQATPWDLAIVASILAIDVALGLFLGAIAGLNEGGLVDAIVTFVGDSVGSIPAFLLAIVVLIGLAAAAPTEVGLPSFVVVFGVILWPTMARTVRERARLVGHETFVEAARASGAPFRRLLVRHIVPNSVGPVLAQIPLDVAPIFFVLAVIPWFVNCQAPSASGTGPARFPSSSLTFRASGLCLPSPSLNGATCSASGRARDSASRAASTTGGCTCFRSSPSWASGSGSGSFATGSSGGTGSTADRSKRVRWALLDRARLPPGPVPRFRPDRDVPDGPPVLASGSVSVSSSPT